MESSDSDEEFKNAPSTPQLSVSLNTPARRKVRGPTNGVSSASSRVLQPSTPLPAAAFKRKREEMTAALFSECALAFI